MIAIDHSKWLILAEERKLLKEEDFLNLPDLFSIRILEKHPDSDFSLVEKYFPRVYNSKPSLYLVQVVREGHRVNILKKRKMVKRLPRVGGNVKIICENF